MTYEVDLAYKIDNVFHEWGRFDRELEEKALELGGFNVSGGTGMGARDLQYEFDTEENALEFEKVVRTIVPKAELEYVGIEELEDNTQPTYGELDSE